MFPFTFTEILKCFLNENYSGRRDQETHCIRSLVFRNRLWMKVKSLAIGSTRENLPHLVKILRSLVVLFGFTLSLGLWVYFLIWLHDHTLAVTDFLDFFLFRSAHVISSKIGRHFFMRLSCLFCLLAFLLLNIEDSEPEISEDAPPGVPEIKVKGKMSRKSNENRISLPLVACYLYPLHVSLLLKQMNLNFLLNLQWQIIFTEWAKKWRISSWKTTNSWPRSKFSHFVGCLRKFGNKILFF